MLKANVGWVERSVRLLIGLPMAVSYVYVRHFSMSWSYGLLVVGLMLIATAFWGWCPIHQLCGSRLPERSSPQPD